MRIFCVPSHHSTVPDPLTVQGVLFTASMLERGIWTLDSSSTASSNDNMKRDIQLHRSKNEQEYCVALQALAELEMPHQAVSYLAVVSLRWCSMFNCLVLTKRTLISIFFGQAPVAAYSHRGYHALYNFLDVFDKPMLDQAIWRSRFETDIVAHWEEILAATHRCREDSLADRRQALAALGRRRAA
jgi:hypothetical protein